MRVDGHFMGDLHAGSIALAIGQYGRRRGLPTGSVPMPPFIGGFRASGFHSKFAGTSNLQLFPRLRYAINPQRTQARWNRRRRQDRREARYLYNLQNQYR